MKWMRREKWNYCFERKKSDSEIEILKLTLQPEKVSQ